MANITICLMVIADLAESGRSVFSWAVIADLSFESLRFVRWVFSHLSKGKSLCSRLWSGRSHQDTFICSSHLFDQKYSKGILSLLWFQPQNQLAILSIRYKKFVFMSLCLCVFWQLLIPYWWRHDHMSMWWRMCPPDRDITGHYRTLVVMAVTTGK